VEVSACIEHLDHTIRTAGAISTGAGHLAIGLPLKIRMREID
jgi:hypothetical protein